MGHNAKHRRAQPRPELRRRSLVCEQLEQRQLLAAGQLSWADTSQLTLSFPPDAVDVAGEPNRMFAKFDRLAPRAEWQTAVLRGFQTWLERSGSNVGVVPESGSWPMGTAGPRTQDRRFGDIRIAARPLADNVKAIAVAHDTVVSGTWGGDVLFNSRASFDSLEELYGIALHEAGHVFGLEHSDDPNSPMHIHGNPERKEPTEADWAEVQKVHGVRLPDGNEGSVGNDTLRTATPITLNLSPSDTRAATTSILFGDITTPDDVDVFSLRVPEVADGSFTIRLQTRRISLLAPHVTITDVSGVTVAESQSTRVGGATLQVRLDDATPGATYFVTVRAHADSPFAVGGYSLVTRFDGAIDVPVLEASRVNDVATLRVREFTQTQLQGFLTDAAFLVDAEESAVDNVLAAVNLPVDQRFELYSRYEAIGSITSRRDVDYYFFDGPQLHNDDGTDAAQDSDLTSTMHLSVRSLELGELVPDVVVLNGRSEPIATEILVNGGGEIVLEAPVLAGERYFIRVRAFDQGVASGLFDQGNYRVTLSFVEAPLELTTFARGQLGPDPVVVPPTKVEPAPVDPTGDSEQHGANHHATDAPPDGNDTFDDRHRFDDSQSLFVALPQLFHFVLSAGGSTERPEAVFATFFDDQDEVVHQLSARPQETRTTHSVLLLPGVYRVRMHAYALFGEPTPRLPFLLRGLSVSDPFAVDPPDPTGSFFLCPGEDELFCYPGGVETDDPFLFDDFLLSLPDIPDLELSELVATLLGDWWFWYWDQQGSAPPPLPIDDRYETPVDQILFANEAEGVLANDIFDDDANKSAILHEGPAHGMLTMLSNGSFDYVPSAGFAGSVNFEYYAFDFQRLSLATATVTIQVGDEPLVPGDVTGDAIVDAEDVDRLCRAITDGENGWLFDLNQDGFVNLDDHITLIDEILDTTAGDADLNGLFNSEDLVNLFIQNEYEDGIPDNSGWETGDWDCDHDFTTTDLVVAFQAGSYVQFALAVGGANHSLSMAIVAGAIAGHATRAYDDDDSSNE